ATLADLFLLQSLPYLLLLLPLVWLIVRAAPWRQPARQWRNDGRRGMELGLANLFTGGVMMAVPPFAMHVGGSRYAALFGLLMTLLSVLMLLPRAISLQMIPQLARHREAAATLQMLLEQARSRLWGLSGVAVFALSSAWVVMAHRSVHWMFGVPGSSAIALLLISYLAISQLSIVSSNVLQVFEDTGFIFSVNGAYVLLVLLAAGLLLLAPLGGLQRLLGLLLAINLLTVVRTALFEIKSRRLVGGVS
ncbi:MAG TPA: hypothetical protein VLC08_09800, partial [Chitinolyticbacter sp.]|nr:hypothetical protein [Chitinolyticbacter sp.]